MLCKICGNEIVGRVVRVNGAKPTVYCSRACGIKASTLRRAARRTQKRTRRECPCCYSMFDAAHGQAFCTRSCALLAHALDEFKREHDSELAISSQAQVPPLELLWVRAANIRQRRGTDHEIFNANAEYQRRRQEHERAEATADADAADAQAADADCDAGPDGTAGAGADLGYGCDQREDLELAPC